MLKQIPAFSRYHVTRDGRVWSTISNKYMKYQMNAKGYKRIELRTDDGKRKKMFVHRLVAMTYISNPDDKPFIDHLNRKRYDCRVENLRWCTNKENCNNIRIGRGTIGKHKRMRNKNYVYQWYAFNKPKQRYFKTESEAIAYQKIIYLLRRWVRNEK